VFGFSFGEILVVVLIGLVIVGPRQLPAMMRTVGQWIGKLRRMAFDMRSESGIDEILRIEGLEKDIRQLQSLVRGNVLDALAVDVDAELNAERTHTQRAAGAVSHNDDLFIGAGREYPVAGCDSFGAISEDLEPYASVGDSPYGESEDKLVLNEQSGPAGDPALASSLPESPNFDPTVSEKQSDG